MFDFFKILNDHKGVSRDVDIDEILKKASSKKGRNFFNFYRMKNNDYGFGFFGLHGRLAAPVGSFKGVGICHNLIPEAFFQTGPWGYFGKGFDVAMQLLQDPVYCLGKGHRMGMDNRYSSCDLFIHLKNCQTNAFGTVRKGRMYLPEDANEMFKDVKPLRPGEYLTRYSPVSGLIFEIVQSNKRVRVLSNCHSTVDKTDIDRFIKDVDVAEEFPDAPLGRRTINTSVLLKDYSITMNNTDCGAGLGGRMTKYHRKSHRLSQPFLDFFTFEIAAVNAFILYRGQNPTYTKGIRQFAEQVITETVSNILNSGERCWIMRQNNQNIPGPSDRIAERFTKKPVSRLSKLQLRNE